MTETPKATGRTCAAACGRPLTTWNEGADGRLWHPACLPPDTPLQVVLSPAAAARRIADLEAERDRYAHIVAAIPDGNNAALLARVRTELAAARRKLHRIDEMATAWKQRFPDTIRTAAVTEALHTTIGDQQ